VSFDHAGSTAFVTGGGSGIGQAIALRLAHEGAAVAVADVRLDAAEATVAEISRDDGRARPRSHGSADATARPRAPS